MSAAIDFVKLDREAVRRGGFVKFVELAWHLIETDPYVHSWQIEEVCLHLQAVTEERIKDLVINIPPGFTKSLLVSVLWPAWVWIERPWFRWIFGSFDLGLALRDAEKMFNIIKSNWFVHRWGQLLSSSTAKFAMGDFENVKGGFRFSTTPHGAGTGRHAHARVVDDPNKPDDAEHATATIGARLHHSASWWKNTMASRGLPKQEGRPAFASVVNMQRIHKNDLSGVCVGEGYTHLCLPMRFDPKRACKTFDLKGNPLGGDRRTEKGELLNPKRFDEATVEAIEKRMGKAVAEAQLQQNPNPAEGLLFKRASFKRFTLQEFPFAESFSVLSIDCSVKDLDDSDFNGFEVWGQTKGQKCCYDSVIVKTDLDGIIATALTILSRWKVNAVLIEGKANGPSAIKALRKRLNNVIEVDPKTAKPERAQAAKVFYEAGSVYHLEGAAWLDRKETNLADFPKSTNDDDVDATTQAILYLDASNSEDFSKAMQVFAEELKTGAFSQHFVIR